MPFLPLPKNTIHLWQFSLLSDELFYASLLSPDEIERANRFYFERHRRRFTIARGILRQLLGQYLDCEPTLIAFDYNPQGKPSVISEIPLVFNLSHSKNTGMLAVGTTHDLGVDLEYYSKRPYDDMAKSLFSTSEYPVFMQAPGFHKTALFFNLWAQKEAFIKAIGLGLSYPTTAFSVNPFLNHPSELDHPFDNKRLKILPIMPHPACAAALCCDTRVQTIRQFHLNQVYQGVESFSEIPLNFPVSEVVQNNTLGRNHTHDLK
jgi:4'-phosphopantetheinyl transferase